MHPYRKNVLSYIRDREITGIPLEFQYFRGIRSVRLRDLKNCVFSKNADGRVEVQEIEHATQQCLVFHRLSHDSTKLVAVQTRSWTLQPGKTNAQLIVYDLLPTYILKTTSFPLCQISMNSILFCLFNQDSSILCAVNALPGCNESKDNGFLSRDPIKIQFALFKQNLCISMNLQSWFETDLNRKLFARSMIKSTGNLFALNYGRSEISIFGFYDVVPWRLMHAKVFKLKRRGLKTESQNVNNLKIKFTIDGLDVTDLLVSDGQDKYNWSLIEINPLRTKHQPGNLYFTYTHFDLDRTFKYATEQTIKKMYEKAKFVCLCRCQATVLEISEDNFMQVYLSGVSQVMIPKAPPFIVTAFLVSWNLNTNQLRYQLVGVKQHPNPYVKNLSDCVKGLEKFTFFDLATSFGFLGGDDSINSLNSYCGDISLYL